MESFNTCSSCEEQHSYSYTTAQTGRFNTCSSCEEQPILISALSRINGFNTCSSCEEQRIVERIQHRTPRFNTCSSCEEQLRGFAFARLSKLFQYMLLLRGATVLACDGGAVVWFQYMLLLRGATNKCSLKGGDKMFQYMLLLRGATIVRFQTVHLRIGFNTCSSCEEQHFPDWRGDSGQVVSIHAPLARSN